jgi:hypothetical protein
MNDPYEQDILDRIHARIEDFAAYLIPQGKRRGNGWVCGGVSGGPGKSCEIDLVGPKWLFHDRATGESGSVWKLWTLNRGVSYPEALNQMADWLGVPRKEKAAPKIIGMSIDYSDPKGTAANLPDDDPIPDATDPDPIPEAKAETVDWDSCLMNFTEERAEAICLERGYSPHFVDWLHEQEMIGTYKGCVAFPVHDASGDVVRIHYKTGDSWRYHPKGGGGTDAPLVIGAPLMHATEVLAFESQWDAFAVLDKLEAHTEANAGRYCAFITRGATSNNNMSKVAVAKLIACPQNDPAEKASKATGRTPAEEWLFKIQSTKHKSTAFSVFETPAGHKDANDWIRADKPTGEEVARLISGAKNPVLDGVKSTDEIRKTNTTDDQSSLIGPKGRFLGKGGSLLVVGPSGIGKSTLTTGIAIHAAAGRSWNGITFRRPLRVLVIQAENDDGDLKEMIDGAFSAVGFDTDTADRAGRNIKWKRETSLTGLEFCGRLEELIRETGAELVMIDPLLSYVGDDILQQKVASTFLRNWLQPVLDRTGAIVVLVHHTGKTPSDSKSRQNWSESDYAYLGLGSSELTNWPRAVAVLVPHGTDTGRFKFLIAKRGKRAGMFNEFTGEKSTSILLKHADRGLGWTQCAPPAESEAIPRSGGRQQKLTADGVMKELGDGSLATRKDILISLLALKHRVSSRTVSERLESLLLLGRAHVSKSEPREGGGKPIEWILPGPEPIGRNQMEASD